MKIHFCDLCNESVPQADLDQGRAFIRKGRVVCSTCENVMTHAPAGVATGAASALASMPAPTEVSPRAPDVAPALPGQPSPSQPGDTQGHVSHLQPIVVRSAGAGGLWVALLGLVFTAGVMFVLENRLHVVQRDQDAMKLLLDRQVGAVDRVERSVALAADAQREYEKKDDARQDAQKARSDKLVDQLAELRAKNDEVGARIASLTVLVNKHEARAGSGDQDLEKRLAELSARLAKNEDDLRALDARVQTVETLPVAVAAPEPAPAVEPAVAAPAEPSWHGLLAGLKDDDNGRRWEAVTGLGATKDLATVPHLLPMLKDLDVFVRMATARVLGEMSAKSAIPNLIDALEDDQTAVREAASIALRTITGKDLKFDPQAIDAERAKRVKAWRDWWKKESEAPSGT